MVERANTTICSQDAESTTTLAPWSLHTCTSIHGHGPSFTARTDLELTTHFRPALNSWWLLLLRPPEGYSTAGIRPAAGFWHSLIRTLLVACLLSHFTFLSLGTLRKDQALFTFLHHGARLKCLGQNTTGQHLKRPAFHLSATLVYLRPSLTEETGVGQVLQMSKKLPA